MQSTQQEIQQSLFLDLISVPPSMRHQSARPDSKPTTIAKFQEDQRSNFDSTSSLHYLIQQKDQQLETLSRKYMQIKQSQCRKPTGMQFMNGFVDDLVVSLKGVSDPQVSSDLIAHVNAMNDIMRVQQTHLKLCQQRLQQCDQLVELCKTLKPAELDNIQIAIQQLYESVQQAQVTELDSTRLYRDVQKANLKYSKLKAQYDVVAKQNEYSEKNMHSYKQMMLHTNEETQLYKRTLRKEQSLKQFNQRRVCVLEQRLDVLSGSEQKKDKDTLRNIIDDMLKENELNKRKAFTKTQEVEKLDSQVQELREKNQKLSKRNALLEKQLKSMGFTSYDLNGNLFNPQHATEYVDTEHDVFKQNCIPNKLDFKLDTLKSKSKNQVMDLLDSGTKQALDQLLKLDKQVQLDQILVYMDQLVQFKLLGDSMNNLFGLLIQLNKVDSIEQLMSQLSGQHLLLNCEAMHLWLIDQQTATFYTMNTKNDTMNAFIDTDEFFNVVKEQHPLYKQQAYMCRSGDTTRFVKDCYLIPLLNDTRLIGILSLENINNKKQDAKYLGLILSQVLQPMLDNLVQQKLLNYQLRYKNILFDAFIDLCKCNTMYRFQTSIHSYAEQLFGISNCHFYFAKQASLTTYTSETHFSIFKQEQGVAGLVAKTQENILASNIKQHQSYHQNIDLNTTFPVFTIYANIGVLQIALNQTTSIQVNNNKSVEMRQLLRPGDTLQCMATMFSQLIQQAYKTLQL